MPKSRQILFEIIMLFLLEILDHYENIPVKIFLQGFERWRPKIIGCVI